MRTLLKILLGSLMLLLLLALGTEIVALHGRALLLPAQTMPPVVVRKSTTAPMPPKTVRAVAAHRTPPARPRKAVVPLQRKAQSY